MITISSKELMNRLFCSFTPKDGLEDRLDEITGKYSILYGKIFVLASPESEEYMCTYNIEVEGNEAEIIGNTILLHRKKETNTLYTINALNALVASLNGGVRDRNFPVNWQEHRNSMLLTNGPSFKKLNTFVHKIVATS